MHAELTAVAPRSNVWGLELNSKATTFLEDVRFQRLIDILLFSFNQLLV